MDEKDENTTGEGLTAEQRELLAQFAARRAARMTVTAGVTPDRTGLESRLREMDEAFEAHPDHDNPLVRENHELKRYTAILEDAVRAFMVGELVVSPRP
ncbi:hypothetical protein [Streptomyces sp. NPDC046862]|uniref:hypothetical protein n=1 Tax=Streptomyces sp. NPDC046862 TaxID=3154603 RepID=UPI0034555EE9